MGGSRFHYEFFFLGKIVPKQPEKPVLIFWSSIPRVFCLYVQKVVGYYDLSVLSTSLMDFQKKLDGGWVGGVSSIQFFYVWNFLNFQLPTFRRSSEKLPILLRPTTE